MEMVIFLIFAFAFAGTNAVPIDDPSGRIAYGIPASNSAFPYAVSIQLATANNLQLETRGHHCGGVLITPRHVLTAASCTFNWQGGIMVPIIPSQYRVFAGSANLTQDSADRVRGVANYTVHPEFLPAPAHLNDIAVIELVSAFNESVATPLSLPSSSFNPSDHTACMVAGWGQSQYYSSQTSSQLLFMTKYIYNQDECRSLYSLMAETTNVFSSMVCAASYNIISTGCYGDEGNALVCDNTLTGISFLHGDGVCQGLSYPELYTRVSSYNSWIRRVTGSASAFKPGVITLAVFTILNIITMKIFA